MIKTEQLETKLSAYNDDESLHHHHQEFAREDFYKCRISELYLGDQFHKQRKMNMLRRNATLQIVFSSTIMLTHMFIIIEFASHINKYSNTPYL